MSDITAAFLLFRRTLRDGLSLRILHRCGEQVIKRYLRPHGILHGPVVLIFPAFERLVVQIALALADNVLSGRLGCIRIRLLIQTNYIVIGICVDDIRPLRPVPAVP